jgi:tetratricopeptide (TPR) repeat protein
MQSVLVAAIFSSALDKPGQALNVERVQAAEVIAAGQPQSATGGTRAAVAALPAQSVATGHKSRPRRPASKRKKLQLVAGPEDGSDGEADLEDPSDATYLAGGAEVPTDDTAAAAAAAVGTHALSDAEMAECRNAQLHLVNVLAELWMSTGNFADTIVAIEGVEARQVRQVHSDGGEVLPIDLAVKCGICKAYVGQMQEAQRHFTRLGMAPVKDYADLYLDAAEALLALNCHGRALAFYERLLSLDEYNQPAIWLKVGRCHLLTPQSATAAAGQQALTAEAAAALAEGRPAGGGIRNVTAALDYYERVLQVVPNNCEAALATARLHKERGGVAQALEMLDSIDVELGRVHSPSLELSASAATALGGAAAVASFLAAVLTEIDICNSVLVKKY